MIRFKITRKPMNPMTKKTTMTTTTTMIKMKMKIRKKKKKRRMRKNKLHVEDSVKTRLMCIVLFYITWLKTNNKN